LWRRPRPKLGCGAKERRRRKKEKMEMEGNLRMRHKERLHNLYASSDIIRVIKSRRMRWAGHAVCMGEMRNA
jgi:hypothetical protein